VDSGDPRNKSRNKCEDDTEFSVSACS